MLKREKTQLENTLRFSDQSYFEHCHCTFNSYNPAGWGWEEWRQKAATNPILLKQEPSTGTQELEHECGWRKPAFHIQEELETSK